MKLVVTPLADVERRKVDAAKLRELADRFEQGAIAEFVIVVNDVENKCYTSLGSFDDRWRILAALEYAKTSIHNN